MIENELILLYLYLMDNCTSVFPISITLASYFVLIRIHIV